MFRILFGKSWIQDLTKSIISIKPASFYTYPFSLSFDAPKYRYFS